MSLEEMSDVLDIGPGAARAIKAALELGRRLMLEANPAQTQVRSPADAAAILMTKYGHLEQEHFVVLLLDTRNRVIADRSSTRALSTAAACGSARSSRVPSMGSSVFTLRSPQDQVKPILHINTQDVSVTRMVVQAGQMMDIEVLDHVVVGKSRFVSLKERGLGF